MKVGKKEKETKAERSFRRELVEQFLKLATSGFGLVAALAWNELVKELIEVFIRPLTGKFSGLISLLIYAMVVTVLAVAVTYYLARFTKKN